MVFWHLPLMQASVVQSLPSLQSPLPAQGLQPPIGANTQAPVSAVQLSAVQPSLSSQTLAVALQVPLAQASVVHAWPSSQAPEIGTNLQPLGKLQAATTTTVAPPPAACRPTSAMARRAAMARFAPWTTSARRANGVATRTTRRVFSTTRALARSRAARLASAAARPWTAPLAWRRTAAPTRPPALPARLHRSHVGRRRLLFWCRAASSCSLAPDQAA